MDARAPEELVVAPPASDVDAGGVSFDLGPCPDAGAWAPRVAAAFGSPSMRGLRLCYEALRREQHLQGRMAIEFVITADGRLRQVREAAVDPVFSPAFRACVVRAFSCIRVLPPQKGTSVTVTYPIVFSPGD